MAICRKCGEQILFRRGPKSWEPCEVDGRDHFDRCKAVQWRKIAAEGVRFEDYSGWGYHWHGKRHYAVQRGKRIVGPEYQPECEDCPVPPWEDCACTEQLSESERAHLREIIG